MMLNTDIDLSSSIRRRIRNLPLPARENYKWYQGLDRTLNGARRCHEEEQTQIREEFTDARNDLGRFDHTHAGYKLNKQNAKAREELASRVDELKADSKALNAKNLPRGIFIAQIDRRLATVSYGCRMRDTKLEKRKGLNALELYELTVGNVFDVRKEIEDDNKRTLTQGEGIPQALADLDALAATGDIDVSGCFRLRKRDVDDREAVQGHVQWPVIEIPNPDSLDRPYKVVNFAAIYARIHYDALKAEILKKCAKYDVPNALSRETRKLRAAEKRATLLDLEYQLYIRIFEARAAGFLEVLPPLEERTGDRVLDRMNENLMFNPMCALGIERDPDFVAPKRDRTPRQHHDYGAEKRKLNAAADSDEFDFR